MTFFYVLVSWSTTALSTNTFCKTGIGKQALRLSFRHCMISTREAPVKRKIARIPPVWYSFALFHLGAAGNKAKRAHLLAILGSREYDQEHLLEPKRRSRLLAYRARLSSVDGSIAFFCEPFKLMTHSCRDIDDKRIYRVQDNWRGNSLRHPAEDRNAPTAHKDRHDQSPTKKQQQQNRMAYMDRWSRRMTARTTGRQ